MFKFLPYIAMQDNPNNKFEQFKTLESTQEFFQWIPDDCKNNILQALQNFWKLENSDERSRCGIQNDLTESMISVKINDEEDVMEYNEYHNEILKKFVWKQLVKRWAIQRLWLQVKLPTEEYIRVAIDSQPWETPEEKYQIFFDKYIKNKLIWHYNTPHTSMHCVNKVLWIRLKNWKILAFSEEKFGIDDPVQDSFFHVMLFDDVQRDIELAKKFPKLESENYKIDKHLSIEEKLKNWWKTEIDPNGIDYLQKNLWWKAYVLEYLGWVPKEFIWEQKFNLFAVDKLWLRSKCLKDPKEADRVLWNLSKDELRKNHNLSGWYNPKEQRFEDIELWNNYRLGTWHVAWISENLDILLLESDSNIFHSIRLVKGR